VPWATTADKAFSVGNAARNGGWSAAAGERGFEEAARTDRGRRVQGFYKAAGGNPTISSLW